MGLVQGDLLLLQLLDFGLRVEVKCVYFGTLVAMDTWIQFGSNLLFWAQHERLARAWLKYRIERLEGQQGSFILQNVLSF